jgi:hypothetical protein
MDAKLPAREGDSCQKRRRAQPATIPEVARPPKPKADFPATILQYQEIRGTHFSRHRKIFSLAQNVGRLSKINSNSFNMAAHLEIGTGPVKRTFASKQFSLTKQNNFPLLQCHFFILLLALSIFLCLP